MSELFYYKKIRNAKDVLAMMAKIHDAITGKMRSCKRSFSIVSHVAQNWNTVLPSLLVMYRKFHELGFGDEVSK
jgi:hypothetical protein